MQLAIRFLGDEHKVMDQTKAAAKDLNDKGNKKAQESAKRDSEMGGMDGLRAIRNKGEYVQRSPLTEWETLAQALLFSNEAAYVN